VSLYSGRGARRSVKCLRESRRPVLLSQFTGGGITAHKSGGEWPQTDLSYLWRPTARAVVWPHNELSVSSAAVHDLYRLEVHTLNHRTLIIVHAHYSAKIRTAQSIQFSSVPPCNFPHNTSNYAWTADTRRIVFPCFSGYSMVILIYTIHGLEW
jgi:hypothetical protein